MEGYDGTHLEHHLLENSFEWSGWTTNQACLQTSTGRPYLTYVLYTCHGPLAEIVGYDYTARRAHPDWGRPNQVEDKSVCR
jgi:hypothetical protein